MTVAPSAFSVSTIFSASSLGTPSFIILGALSTNFLLSTKLSPSIDLTSLMTFGFAPASNFSSLRLKSVFSWAAGAASSSSTGAAAAGPAAPAANPPMGMSGMFRRVCMSQHTASVHLMSAVSSSVNWLICSTMVAIFGLDEAAASDAHLRCIRCCVAPIVGRRGRACCLEILRSGLRPIGLVAWQIQRSAKKFENFDNPNINATTPPTGHIEASELWEGAPRPKHRITLAEMEGTNYRKTGKTVNISAFAAEALKPAFTDALFVLHGELFTELCARWIQSSAETEAKVSAFGRLLPLAPHLAEHVERFLAHVSNSPIIASQTPAASQNAFPPIRDSDLIEVLLGSFRLLSYDCRNFAKYVRPLALESLFQHSSRVVRYLAVRVFCLYVHAADYATQEMTKRYVGEEEIDASWEGEQIDFRFLSLWEEKRWKNLQSKMPSRQSAGESYAASVYRELSPYTVNVNGVLLPRLDGESSQEKPSELVSTRTTEANLKSIAHGLLGSSPILLTGLAGSGKTLLTRHFAWQLNKLDKMVTLHLNEQSDAKLLIGMYTTGAKPGTFSWRAGVLTTAVREGRWIFIEDLDRAPNEVISTLLPLIERGELLIPSRGETIRAARGFRIIATMRSTLNPRGQEIVPRQNMIGHRFWNSITVQMPQLEEFKQVIHVKYPALQKHLSGIMHVYARLLELYSDAKFSSENGTSLRAMTPRDLLKWCDRIAVLLAQSTSFTNAQKDDIFMEAFDCFAGSLRSESARLKVMACVAEELHIDPQRRDHLMKNRVVKLQVPSKTTSSGTIQIGRAKLSKHRSLKRTLSGRPFSTNDYTLRLLEKIAVAVDRQEPLLLVGETGTGKTTCIQYLAEQLGRKLVAFNLSQQSESGDLLGGFKPVNVRSLVIPLKDEFDDIFDTTFSRKKNLRFIEMLGKRVAKGEWKRVCALWREALKMVDAARKTHESQASSPDPDGGQPKKKRKMDSLPPNFPTARWEKFAADLNDLEAQLTSGSEAFAFSFLEGNIVKAVRNGDWVLLDEINLASSDTLEALTDLLGGGPDGNPSILLTETGNVERVVAHPNFRVFAAMNPATDVGKKDLPSGIRSRFTELYVESPDGDEKSLRNIVEKYLGGDGMDPAIIRVARDVTSLYLEIQQRAKANMLVDGANQKAHFSLRTLTRTLTYARDIAPMCSLRRALYEGFHMSFLTFLSKASEDLVAPLITTHLFPQKAVLKAELGKPLQQPSDGRGYVKQGHYWLRQGVHDVEEQSHYIMTPFVQRNMNNLIRAASTRKYPVLIQGPTSSGKTSMIEYLAKKSGNKFVRINNHEHTDLQEYLGSYISGADGKLVFQEGILVRALREGHWIVLDELNLAPTDVLEALNRLLDDNRELLIPETQEVVRPHEDFMLFATQNPAGLYGGRKVLSRAFRNRFLELHFDDIPVEELTEILHKRTMIPETWCKRIVKVYRELSKLRQENRLFEQKSFATLRDLFRWAQRKADTIQDLANNGYMLLAERVRKEEERVAVKKILETVMSEKGPRVTIDEEQMFSTDNWSNIEGLSKDITCTNADVVWTRAMRRLFSLVAYAIRNNEPVLLIGETGCGKTTVCQLLADQFNNQLHIVNAHQNTETGDLIGAQRPIRNRAAIEDLLRQQVLQVLAVTQHHHNHHDPTTLGTEELLATYDKIDKEAPNVISEADRKNIILNRVKAGALFEWADGSLVYAMKQGHYFLLDEISLADDSVLERLNSVLEPSRTLLLAEKGPTDSDVSATDGFQFLATMNPGGDYGKKELSPALRNRFTEIWVPAMSDLDDILQIVRSKLKPDMVQYAGAIVSFSQWFNDKYNTSVASSISIRDSLSWVSFANKSTHGDSIFAIVHGAAMVFIDTLGANPAGLLAISATSIDDERKACLHHLSKLLGQDVAPLYFGAVDICSTDQFFQLGAFSVPKFSSTASEASNFSLEAPTTRSNAMRVVRALQLAKPILLEGNPGVGKTTLVTALARAVGKPLTRLNLSEQTDLMDLFGSDVPVEGGAAGTFAWRDAPFLKAMKSGDWVLLDEMNLASQSVLEGLNAVLDHRGEVYISELDQTFHKHQDFRVFAAQNPHHQGGGRKGLPASFVNRFTVVYADVFRPEDLTLICRKVFPSIEEQEVTKLIRFVAELDEQVVNRRSFGNLGAPWEFNLRDTLRWLQLLASQKIPGSARDFLDTIFVQRFRAESDRNRLRKLFENQYGAHEPRMSLFHNLSTKALQVGLGLLSRDTAVTRPDAVSTFRVPQLAPMEALLVSVKQNWPVVIVGAPGSGKTAMINQLASFVGANLVTFSMNADVDAMDLVGGYEQVDATREVHQCLQRIEDLVRRRIATMETPVLTYVKLLELLQTSSAMLNSATGPLLEVLAGLDSEASSLAQELQRSLQASNGQIDGARFQWVDGILIRALQQGKWLVLDNANLCSSAVLDRLNSLLEPNGYLSINEHSTADGEARIVKPHSDFRIFMTIDPRFGELSRAMRNRAVEICLLESEPQVCQGDVQTLQYPLDSSVYRFRQFQEREEHLAATMVHRFENLGLQDNELLKSFTKQAQQGLTSIITSAPTNGLNDHDAMQLVPAALTQDRFSLFAQFLQKAWAPHAQSISQQLGSDDLTQLVPYHPLGNELVLNRTESSQSLSVWNASMYEIMSDLYDMQQAFQNLPSARFERRKEKQKLPAFLHAYWQGLVKVVEGLWDAHRQGHRFDTAFLEPLRSLYWAFHALTTASMFDRATFQTYLKMLTSAIPAIAGESTPLLQIINTTLSKQIAVFGSDVQLTTGLGMERIWRAFKPKTPKTESQLRALLELESLADRLDSIMWKSNLRVDEMVQIRERIASSLDLVRKDQVDATELITSLGVAIQELEESIAEDDMVITPYFEEEFEGLCQFLDVAFNEVSMQRYTSPTAAVVSTRAKSALFARRPTKLATVPVGRSVYPTDHFAKSYRHLGLTRQAADAMVLQGRFHTSVLAKLCNADEVQLGQLDRFESELQVLSQQASLDAGRITQDQWAALDRLYSSVYSQLIASQSTDVLQDANKDQVTFFPEAAITDAYRSTLEKGIANCSQANGSNVDAKAWIQLGLFGLCLYVPNYPHDPALRPMIERKMFNAEKDTMLQVLGALRQFQLDFTGNDTSFRIRQVEKAIQKMGEEPPVPAIARPEASQLDDLQGEFTNLLSAIQPLLIGLMSVEEAARDTTLQQNLLRIIQRLTEGYRAYDDITDTAVGFLVCLQIGLLLGQREEEKKAQSTVIKSLAYMSWETPFFGRSRAMEKSVPLLQAMEDGLSHASQAIDLRWHTLHSLKILKNTDPVAMSSSKARNLIHDLFSSLYGDWKTKLLQDQEKEALNTDLYTYRGMDDDADEEDPTLFPDYEADQEQEAKQPVVPSDSRDHAIRLADIHAELFLQGPNASDSIKAQIEWCATELNRVSGGKSHGSKHEDALPAIYLALEKKANALSSLGTAKTYNFYFDANLSEAKRLIGLIHRIQVRYRQIRNVWPEHATLSEVLRTCDEALEFRHVDPVAKFITKAEKLHTYMHEWQKVASKEYSTVNLYDDLTKLLVSWRELELTTWAKLFDMEESKCRDDAKSWFFVAYETVIAASGSVEDEKSLRLHAKGLLKSLEIFFENTSMGQFEHRIKLLQQLRQHAAMRMQDVEAFEIIHVALDNFLAYYSRLEKPVHEALAKGRLNLEKQITDVIKLASWKDTNIEALKASAKTSHRKLSRLVRKFRALLNQPISGIMRVGFPEESHLLQCISVETVHTATDPSKLELCASSIPGWDARPMRFKNLGVTVSMMRNLAAPKTDTADGASYISELITELSSSMVELQKATPTTLTEENKESVQQLKTQKRKLYADIMKELRLMGVNSNLSVDTLAKQDDLSTVLSTIPLVKGNEETGRAAEYYLHKALNIMSQVRAVYREHSGDLTPNDVARSIGYLEGLLYVSIRQRNVLSKAAQSFRGIEAPMSVVADLCQTEHGQLAWASEQQVEVSGSLQPQLRWLVSMLKTGTDIVNAQAKMGKTNELDALIQHMREWTTELHELADSYDRLPKLPSNIQSDAHQALEKSVIAHMNNIQATFKGWIDNNDIARTVLRHIEPFLFEPQAMKAMSFSEDQQITVGGHVQEIFGSLDLILGSMQDVETAVKGLPASTDDASWLVKEEQALSAALNALHAPQISSALQTLLDRMQYLYADSNLQCISALFASVKPILDQYVASHKYLVKRFDALHAATASLLHRLSKSFIQIGTQGFCQPPDKSSDQQKGKDDKLESGTGLGEGEGAEDISKDIEDDEDLEDLAQEQKGEREGSIEEQEDAVDMGEQEMEGETEEVGEKEDKGDESGEDGDDDAQSEVGSVDDLGPSAVDEKMWDDGGKEDDAKDKEGKQDVGTENEDEQVAAEQKEKEKEKSGKDGEEEDKEEKKDGEEDEEMEMEGEDQEENVGVGEKEKMDPHAKEEETLDLPEDLNMDGQDDEDKEDDLGEMDMGDDVPEDEMDPDTEPGAPDTVDEEIGPEQEGEEEKDTTGHIEDEEQPPEEQDEEGEEPMDDDAVPLPDENTPDDETRDTKETDQPDLNAEAGAGTEANEEAHKNKNEQASASAANQDEGQEGESSEQKQDTTAEDGQLGQTAAPDASGRGEEPEESRETQSFKKLGDVLEKWHNQQKQISEAREKDETQVQQIDKEVDMADADFEHLGDEEQQADTQALGTASEDQAKALDHDMAIPVTEEEEKMATRPEDNDEETAGADEDVDMEDAEQHEDQEQEAQQQQSNTAEGQPQAFVGEQKSFPDQEDEEMIDALSDEEDDVSSTSTDNIETQLSLTHLDGTTMDPNSARALWISHEASTHSLSQQLTEHLRLILAPTLATKLRGDFRTGKRLNLKRIIPYIASGYKRDKIWLRRSMPSKRSYQVMIALDDSSSMADSGASNLALKTLTLVTRSLSMLEVGEVSVVGFGDTINVAHDFDKPFTSEAGVRVFEQFGFDAKKTNMRGLVDRSLELFKDARQKGSSSAGEDLWQLMLIVSDGIFDNPAEIQRLVRKAQEERVMIVFVIIDSSAVSPSPSEANDAAPVPSEQTAAQPPSVKAQDKKSVLELEVVNITDEGKVVRWNYMERFPFPYYLVVRDVRELPGVLAVALRQWFGEVAGTA
ncbi:midasin [Clathrospora elynae]|uniref:Midasin n=1 Tax=Clathrospora elynae TaxID=706981 RepID=A0A6A5SCZ4_9PLEO|nr:midasin [Clathrospora elynae]